MREDALPLSSTLPDLPGYRSPWLRVGLAAGVLVLLGLAGLAVSHVASVIMTPDPQPLVPPGNYVMSAGNVRVGDHVDDGITVATVPGYRANLASVAMRDGVPRGVLLQHVGIYPGVNGGSYGKYPKRDSTCARWHTWRRKVLEGCTHRDLAFCCFKLQEGAYKLPHGMSYRPLPVDGFRASTREDVLVLSFMALKPGIYTLGPVVVRGTAYRPGQSGQPFTQTLDQRLVDCVGAWTRSFMDRCNAVDDRLSSGSP